jgi:hypothetical protein
MARGKRARRRRERPAPATTRTHGSAGPTTRAEGSQWRQRRLAALVVRVVTVLVPLAVSVVGVVEAGRTVHRPSGGLVVAWYAGLCLTGWLVSWWAHHVLQRLLPLALLLEMSLVFPGKAPSRLRIAKRAASDRDLKNLVANSAGTIPETTQQSAERILALVSALGRHDRRTRGHSERVRAFTDLIGIRMGLPQRDRDRLRWASLLHDIGKLRIPAKMLNKPGKLTAAEWDVMRLHPQYGEDVVAPLREWLGPWNDVVVQHHERWDGGGYPRGLAGTEICLGARIVAVADAYDVMTAARAYKKAVGRAAALKELVQCSGGQFDPQVVRALLATPRRQLILVMGPMSWLLGLPLIGQANAALSAAAAAPAGVAAGAVVTAGVSLAPGVVHAHPPVQPATSVVAPATQTPTTSGSTTGSTAGSSPKPTAKPTAASAKKSTRTTRTVKATAKPTRTHTSTHTHPTTSHPHSATSPR